MPDSPSARTRRGVLRAVLAAGALGALAPLSGCGLRLDRDPELPELSPADVLRDRIARILAAVEISDDTGLEVVATLSEALGAPWNPPDGLKTPAPTPSPAEAQPLADALDACAAEALAAEEALTGELAGTLIDVVSGALIALSGLDAGRAQERRAELAAAADAALLSVVDASPSASADPTEEAAADSQPTDSPDDGLGALVTACRQGAYAYERAAVHHDPDSPVRAAARARIDALDSLAAVGDELLVASGRPSVADRPAWDLAVEPVDAATALECSRTAEDALASAVLAALPDIPGIAALRWLADSGFARAAADGRQLLRFSASGEETSS